MFENLTQPLRSQVNLIINGRKKPIRPPMPDTKMRHPNAFLEFIHRIFDVWNGLMMLIFLCPAIVAISLAIYITSGAPVFFRQKRLGKDGKLFTMYKFRTMRNDAEEILKNDPQLYEKYVKNDYKLSAEDDPRITKLGWFLRRSSLDEIPQFLNVVRGDMSIVGPRPIVPPEIERYGEHADVFLSVKPGITGLWQVTGRSSIGYPERKYLDLIYVQNRSLALDLKIMAKTIEVVFRRVGAH